MPEDGTERHCPTCEKIVQTTQVGTAPHIDTGEPVDQLECGHCCAVADKPEFEQPLRISRRTNTGSDEERRVNVQRQITRQGRVEYAGSYQRVGEYEDGTEYTGVPLSLFIKDEPTIRELDECLREIFEERSVSTVTERSGGDDDGD